MTRLISAAALSLFLGCAAAPSPSASWPDDPATEQDAAAQCDLAAATLDRLRCGAADANFAEVCRYYVARGVPLHPQCIARATSCSEADAC